MILEADADQYEERRRTRGKSRNEEIQVCLPQVHFTAQTTTNAFNLLFCGRSLARTNYRNENEYIREHVSYRRIVEYSYHVYAERVVSTQVSHLFVCCLQ